MISLESPRSSPPKKDYKIPEKLVSLLGPESATLRTLSTFRFREKALPELHPFPFVPELRHESRKRNPGKVPKPSKFVKGEMYHSDYDSGSESFGGKFKFPVKWRSCSSDNEDTYHSYRSDIYLPNLAFTLVHFTQYASSFHYIIVSLKRNNLLRKM